MRPDDPPLEDPDGVFTDADPTPVNTRACPGCGTTSVATCPGCGDQVTLVIPCDAPSLTALDTGAHCLLSVGRWFYCHGSSWFCINQTTKG